MNNYYNPYPYPNYTQFQPQPQTGAYQTPVQQPQIQNGGFMSVRSEAEAFNYPVALGTSITFKDDNAPFIYVKTRDFSQMKEPIFEKYRLIKEDMSTPPPAVQGQANNAAYATKNEVDMVRAEVEAMRAQITAMLTPPEPQTAAKTTKAREAKKNDET